MENNIRLKTFIRYSSLNVLGMLGLSCYILADTFFIAQGLGIAGLTALNLAIPAFNFIYSFGLMLGMGGGTRYTIAQSRGQQEKADEIFTNTIMAAIAISLLFEMIGILFCERLTYLLGADEETFEMTNMYLRMLFIFSPAFTMNNVIMPFIRNDGNPKLSMAAMVTGSFSNIILDYIFIFPMGMGIFGAVLATCMSPIISIGVLSIHVLKKKNNFHLKPTRPKSSLILGIMSLGVPSFVTEMSGGIVIMIFNMIILSIEGNIGVAAYGVVANISIVVIAIFNGIAQGTQPLISEAYGKSDGESIRKFMKYAVFTVAMVSAVVYSIIFFFPEPIASIFNSENSSVLEIIAVDGLRIYFTGIIFAGVNICAAIYFSSMEKALPAQIISLLRGVLIIVPMAFLLSRFLEITGVWLSFPATEAVVSVIGIILIIKNNRRNKE